MKKFFAALAAYALVGCGTFGFVSWRDCFSADRPAATWSCSVSAGMAWPLYWPTKAAIVLTEPDRKL